jgi:hypothetical protein
MSGEITEVPSTFGPIPVAYIEDLKAKSGAECMGLWDLPSRTIRIRSGMHAEAELQTIWHEWLHSVLSDSGVSATLKNRQEEAVVDAIGTALARFATFTE